MLADLLVRFLNERNRRIVEAEMNLDQEEYLTEWGKAYGRMRAQALAEGHSTGVAEGRAEGLAAGLTHALLTVLNGRGLEPTKAQHAQIERCRSPRLLEKWLARALVAETVAEVLRR